MENPSNGFLTIIRDHTGWPLMRNRKQKNILLISGLKGVSVKRRVGSWSTFNL